jgi:hypothetical protein
MLKKILFASISLAFSSIALTAQVSSANHTSSTTFTPGSSPLGGIAGCNMSSPSSARSYGTASFTSQSAGSYSFQVTGSTAISDPFMAVYRGSFDPSSPANNLVGCNDDGRLPPNIRFPVFTANLDANTTYIAVVTNYDGGASDGTISFNIGKNPDISLSNATFAIDAVSPSMVATSDSPVSITYTSSNVSVATIDANTGALTLVGAGTTTITASQAAQADPLLFRAGTKTATLTVTAPVIVNGACGTSAGQALAYVPSTNLCSAGTASLVTSSNAQYTWTCSGTGGGTNASCAAPWATNAGTGSGSLSASGNGWTVSSASFAATPTATPPAGVTFPNGLLDLRLSTGSSGTDATVVVQYTTAVPAGAVYMKYGKTAANQTDHWYQLDASRAVFASDRMSVTLTLTDGGAGDHDLLANGTIVDPGGPALVPAPTAVPTLSEWAMIFLASLMGLFAFARIRRQS